MSYDGCKHFRRWNHQTCESTARIEGVNTAPMWWTRTSLTGQFVARAQTIRPATNVDDTGARFILMEQVARKGKVPPQFLAHRVHLLVRL